MQGGISRRIGLFALLFGIPLLFLYLLAKGDPNIESLKFYGKEITDTGKQKIKDFVFYDVDSNQVTKETLKGKTLITTILIPSCPSLCPIISRQVDEFVYKKMIDREKFKDFLILSQLVDTTGKSPNLKSFIGEQTVNPNKWLMVTGEENNIYDINFNVVIKDYTKPWYYREFEKPKIVVRNLLKDNIPNSNEIGGKTYYKMLLLIDKNHYIRGIYQGDKTLEIERLNKEINVLEREYSKEAKNQKK